MKCMHISLPSLTIMQNKSLPQTYIRSKAISANCYYCVCLELLFVFGVTAPQWARASSFMRFQDQTQ